MDKARELLNMGMLKGFTRSKSSDDAAASSFDTTRRLLSLPPGSSIAFAPSKPVPLSRSVSVAEPRPQNTQIGNLLSVDGRLMIPTGIKPTIATRLLTPAVEKEPSSQAVSPNPSAGQSLIKKLQPVIVPPSMSSRQILARPKESNLKKTISVILNSSNSSTTPISTVTSTPPVVINPNTKSYSNIAAMTLAQRMQSDNSNSSGKRGDVTPLISTSEVLSTVSGSLYATASAATAGQSATLTTVYPASIAVANIIAKDKLTTVSSSPIQATVDTSIKLQQSADAGREINVLPAPRVAENISLKQPAVIQTVFEGNKQDMETANTVVYRLEGADQSITLQPSTSVGVGSESSSVITATGNTSIVCTSAVDTKEGIVCTTSTKDAGKAQVSVSEKTVSVQLKAVVSRSTEESSSNSAKQTRNKTADKLPVNVEPPKLAAKPVIEETKAGIDCLDSTAMEVLSPGASSTLSAHSLQAYTDVDIMPHIVDDMSIIVPGSSMFNPETEEVLNDQ